MIMNVFYYILQRLGREKRCTTASFDPIVLTLIQMIKKKKIISQCHEYVNEASSNTSNGYSELMLPINGLNAESTE